MHVLIFSFLLGQVNSAESSEILLSLPNEKSPPILISVHGINLYFEIYFWIIMKSVYPPILWISSAERICGIHGNT